MGDRNKVIEQFLGDASTPVEWSSEEEKKLHFWFDDLHCPQPISPMYFDIGGWWYTCDYMFRRFGVPFGKVSPDVHPRTLPGGSRSSDISVSVAGRPSIPVCGPSREAPQDGRL